MTVNRVTQVYSDYLSKQDPGINVTQVLIEVLTCSTEEGCLPPVESPAVGEEDTTQQDFLDDLSARRGNCPTVGGDHTIWFLELSGATVIEPTAFEPDPATYRGTHYYNVQINTLYRKIITRQESGVVVAYWQKVSD